MSNESKDTTFLDVLKYPLLLQQVNCLSPFTIKDKRLVPNLFLSLYAYTYIILYIFTVITSIWMIRRENEVWVKNTSSYLWIAIICCELLFTNLLYPFMIIYLERHKQDQIFFLNNLMDLDALLQQEFNWNFSKFYTQHQFRQHIELSISILYYNTLYINLLYVMHNLGHGSLGMFLFLSTYHLEQCSTGITSWTIINSIRILESKFTALKHIQNIVFNTSFESKLTRKRKIGELLRIYKRLCFVINEISWKIGSILIVRYAHDFSLSTFQCYYIYWCLVNDKSTHKVENVLATSIWMTQNFVKMGWTSLACYNVVRQVKFACIKYICT